MRIGSSPGRCLLVREYRLVAGMGRWLWRGGGGGNELVVVGRGRGVSSSSVEQQPLYEAAGRRRQHRQLVVGW